MDILRFIELIDFYNLKEIEKVKHLLLYNYKINGVVKFTMNDICSYLEETGNSIPNTSRLKSNMIASKTYRYDKNSSSFEFLPVPLKRLEKELSPFFVDTESIQSNGEFIDERMFCGYRGYLDKLIQQVNCTYSCNCFDACAVLLRRIFEICLILTYQRLNVDSEIKNSDGTYVLLERIISNAINNHKLNLSRIKNEYEKIRNLGNFAAHRIEYNTSKSDLDRINILYRTALEELYYKSGLKN